MKATYNYISSNRQTPSRNCSSLRTTRPNDPLSHTFYKQISAKLPPNPDRHNTKFSPRLPVPKEEYKSSVSRSPIKSEYQGAFFTGNIDNYTQSKILGQGAYAIVKLGADKFTQQSVAIKTYDKRRLVDPKKKRNLKREVHILGITDHPNIIRMIEAAESARQVHIITEYVGGCSLDKYIKMKMQRRIDENEARRIFIQVVQAVDYCHNQQIAHRDIKLDNILLDSKKNPKLIDFGFSLLGHLDTKIKTFCGTPSYMAPEIVNKQEFVPAPTDIWALGIVLYVMITGGFPFKGINERDLYRKIARGVFEFPSYVSPGPRQLIKRILNINPNRRPNCQEILRDQWLQEHINRTPLFSRPPIPDKPKADGKPSYRTSSACSNSATSTAALSNSNLQLLQKSQIATLVNMPINLFQYDLDITRAGEASQGDPFLPNKPKLRPECRDS